MFMQEISLTGLCNCSTALTNKLVFFSIYAYMHWNNLPFAVLLVAILKKTLPICKMVSHEMQHLETIYYILGWCRDSSTQLQMSQGKSSAMPTAKTVPVTNLLTCTGKNDSKWVFVYHFFNWFSLLKLNKHHV